MQRVRIGLTGLAVVFLLVLLAAIFSSPSDEAPITANTIEQGLVPGGQANLAETAEPKEPLAELGVAPPLLFPKFIHRPVSREQAKN